MSEKAETNELTTDKANSENCANTSGAKVHQEKNSHSDDSDSDSDNDIDDTEIEQIEQEILGVKSMLRRYCGRHKNVAKLKSEHSQWLTSVVTGAKDFVNLEGSNIQETIALVNKAEENERTRRMSIPFSADENETDLDLSLASTQLSNVHQELLHLFAIHDAKYQMECERERLTVENTKMRLHEQLLSNMARRKARDIFEMERKRKIEEMKRLTETVSAEGIAMAETNARLSQVHVDLKNAFQKMRDAKAAKEDIERKRSEEHKEMMLQEFRRRPVGNESQILEQERMRRQDLYCQQLNEPQQSHESLLQVQEQLLKIFAKLKREKKLKKIEIRQNQEDNKERMQEELVRRSLQKVVLNQEAQEKARRIKNSTSRTSDQKDDAKSKAIDMLVDVQKQLLDVFAIAKIQDVKERMNHLKVMNCRQNMLREIRSRTDNQENKRGFIKSMPSTPAAKQGKRLSLIGERFKVEVGNASSPGRSSK